MRVCYTLCCLLIVVSVSHLQAQKTKLSVAGFKTGCIKGDCENGKGVLALVLVQRNPDFSNEFIWQNRNVEIIMGYLVGEFNAKQNIASGRIYGDATTLYYREKKTKDEVELTLFEVDGNIKYKAHEMAQSDYLNAMRRYNQLVNPNSQEKILMDYYIFEGTLTYTGLSEFYNQKQLIFSDEKLAEFFIKNLSLNEGSFTPGEGNHTFKGLFADNFPFRGTVSVSEYARKSKNWLWHVADTHYTDFTGAFDYIYTNWDNDRVLKFIPKRGRLTSSLGTQVVDGVFTPDNKPIGLLITSEGDNVTDISLYDVANNKYQSATGVTNFKDVYNPALPTIRKRVMITGYSDSLYYEGQHIKGIPHGLGMLFYEVTQNKPTIVNAETLYWGFFKDGLPDGPGSYIKTPEIETSRVGTYQKGVLIHGSDGFYLGDFVAGVYHGKGKLEKESISYEGSFINGKFNGYGVHRFKQIENGQTFYETYTGLFADGNFSGKGKLVTSKETLEGIFEFGRLKEGSKITEPIGAITTGMVVQYTCGTEKGKSFVQRVSYNTGLITLANRKEIDFKNCKVDVLNESTDQFYSTCSICHGAGEVKKVTSTPTNGYTTNTSYSNGNTISGPTSTTTYSRVYITRTTLEVCSLCEGAGRILKYNH